MQRYMTALVFAVVTVVMVVILGSPFYVLKEGNQAVITRLGKPVGGPVRKTGLHFKTPFIEKVNRFESRLLEWDGDANQIPTKDKRFIWIDSTARWKISDPLKFFQSVGDEMRAQTRLDDILDSATRDAVTEQPLIEIVRSSNRDLTRNTVGESEGIDIIHTDTIHYGRDKLTRSILEKASQTTPKYGIELVDVRIKRIIYIDDVLEKIYERMVAERKKAAEMFRSEGQGRKAEIEGETSKELNRVRSEAYHKSQQIKGLADAEAASIYANAYGQGPDLYRFTRTLETYEKTIDERSTLVLTTDSDYFKYLKKAN